MKKYLLLIALLFGMILMTPGFCKQVSAKNTYTINTSTAPCNGDYRRSNHYNGNTKHYFTLRSYTEKLRKEGGGTLVVKAGTYKLTNTIYIPSNTTIVFEKGVTINHCEKTGVKGLKASDSLFQFVEGKNASKKHGYGGVHNVTFKGNGATLNCGGHAMGFIMGHNKDIKISGINFVNMKSNKHLIELNSSKDVTISNCTFNANTANKSGHKECINIDYDYKKGFNNKWGSHDKTHCQDITIKNCTFKNSRVAIGSHYNKTKKYHTNIKIASCSFSNIKKGWVKGLHWKNVTLSNLSYADKGSISVAAAKKQGLLPELSLSQVNEKYDGIEDKDDDIDVDSDYDYDVDVDVNFDLDVDIKDVDIALEAVDEALDYDL